MNPLDKILNDYGLKYEDLNIEERDTYNQANFKLKEMTVADIRKYVSDMKNSIALQICDVEYDVALKARLKNYILLEAFLSSPDAAEKALRDAMATLKLQKGK
jgi:hypothetical protein